MTYSHPSLDRAATPKAASALPLRLLCITTLILYSAWSPSYADGDWKTEIGYVRLQQRLGDRLPRGAAVPVTQIEMAVNGNRDYAPDLQHTQFAGKNVSRQSGRSGVSGHATTVAEYFFGSGSSVSPDVPRVTFYDASDWAEAGFLNVRSNAAPAGPAHLVQNHSWVGSFGLDSIDSDVLRRVDYVVERDGIVVVAGVKNGTASPLPKLMCSAYNVIAVGLTSAESSFGPTQIEGERVKPDLVAPLTATSWATPVVAGSASVLVEALEAAGHLKQAGSSRTSDRALLCKALLMGGATKSEWADWRKGFERPCDDGSVPLDYRYGAGELNIDNSYRILEAGRQPPGRTVELTGWDLGTAPPNVVSQYALQVPGCRSATVSVLLTWNRQFTVGVGTPLAFTPHMADMDLRLVRTSSNGAGRVIDASVSRRDNVEHVFIRNLPPGEYVIEVTTDRAWKYALTWDVQLETPPGCEDRRMLVRETPPPVHEPIILTSASPSPAGERDITPQK